MDVLILEVTKVANQLFNSVQKYKLSVRSKEDRVKQQSKRQMREQKKKKRKNYEYM